MLNNSPKTLFEKIWDQHVVVPETEDTPAILYIDLHMIHEVTTPQAFSQLKESNLKVKYKPYSNESTPGDNN